MRTPEVGVARHVENGVAEGSTDVCDGKTGIITGQAQFVTDEAKLELISAAAPPVVDVVFVHGLTGDAKQTWTNETTKGFWPAWLHDELEKISVYSLGYPASVLDKLAKKEMDLFERAGNVLELFAGYGIGARPVAFVAHSLGGLLVKLILRKSCDAEDQDWRRVSESTKLVVFLATPHLGSELANFAKAIPYTSNHVMLLANEVGFLDDLNGHYRTFTKGREDLTTVAYYEKHLTKGVVVVSSASADPGVAGATPIAIDKGHMDICKPSNTEDTVYLGVKRRIQKLVEMTEESGYLSGGSTLAEDYDEKSTEDRRDLHQKLMEAGREHEYAYANNAQNGFARRYTKTGLLTAAREDHANLLAEVETRFVTQVYHPLICQSASDEAVASALQERVIDTLAGKSIGGTKFDAKSVLSALYFLTEQCYIRWDAPK